MGEGGILTKIVAKVENNFKLRKKSITLRAKPNKEILEHKNNIKKKKKKNSI